MALPLCACARNLRISCSKKAVLKNKFLLFHPDWKINFGDICVLHGNGLYYFSVRTLMKCTHQTQYIECKSCQGPLTLNQPIVELRKISSKHYYFSYRSLVIIAFKLNLSSRTIRLENSSSRFIPNSDLKMGKIQFISPDPSKKNNNTRITLRCLLQRTYIQQDNHKP